VPLDLHEISERLTLLAAAVQRTDSELAGVRTDVNALSKRLQASMSRLDAALRSFDYVPTE